MNTKPEHTAPAGDVCEFDFFGLFDFLDKIHGAVGRESKPGSEGEQLNLWRKRAFNAFNAGASRKTRDTSQPAPAGDAVYGYEHNGQFWLKSCATPRVIHHARALYTAPQPQAAQTVTGYGMAEPSESGHHLTTEDIYDDLGLLRDDPGGKYSPKWIHDVAQDAMALIAPMIFAAPQPPAAQGGTFQQRVAPWMQECFGAAIASDVRERGDRLLEEVLELLQSHGYDPTRVSTLRDYVFGRPVGEPQQEVGGVMVTLAAYCLATGIDMHDAGEVELARITQPEVIEKIRTKQASKRGLHTPLPGSEGASDQMIGYTTKKFAKKTRNVGQDLPMYSKPQGEHTVAVYVRTSTPQLPSAQDDDLVVPAKLLDEINATGAVWRERALKAEASLDAQAAEKRAPVQRYHGKTIPWRVHGLAWEGYAKKYGTSQSAGRLAERGGFGIGEMDEFLPGWRELAHALDHAASAQQPVVDEIAIANLYRAADVLTSQGAFNIARDVMEVADKLTAMYPTASEVSK